jgi:hypothetical protein
MIETGERGDRDGSSCEDRDEGDQPSQEPPLHDLLHRRSVTTSAVPVVAFDPTAPTPLDGVTDVAEALGLERLTSTDVMRAGLLGPTYVIGRALAVEAGRAASLKHPSKKFTHLDAGLPTALIVKVRPARPETVDPDREWVGWHAALSDEARADGVRGWWTVRAPERLHGHLLVATVAGIVAEVWRITGHETMHARVTRFDVRPAGDDRDAARYIGHWMPPVQGGPVLRVPAR